MRSAKRLILQRPLVMRTKMATDDTHITEAYRQIHLLETFPPSRNIALRTMAYHLVSPPPKPTYQPTSTSIHHRRTVSIKLYDHKLLGSGPTQPMVKLAHPTWCAELAAEHATSPYRIARVRVSTIAYVQEKGNLGPCAAIYIRTIHFQEFILRPPIPSLPAPPVYPPSYVHTTPAARLVRCAIMRL